MLKLLINHGAAIKDANGYSLPLLLASIHGNIEIVQYLTLKQPNPTMSDKGHNRKINCCVFSVYTNKFFITGSEDQTLRVWDIETGICLRTLSGVFGTICCCAISVNDEFVIAGSTDKVLRMWDVNTGDRIGKFKVKSFVKKLKMITEVLYEK